MRFAYYKENAAENFNKIVYTTEYFIHIFRVSCVPSFFLQKYIFLLAAIITAIIAVPLTYLSMYLKL